MRIEGTVADSRQANFRPAALAALFDVAGATSAFAQPLAPHPYADLSLEELANVVITSVARRPQALAAAAASVYLITGDDLRRSGVLTLPEALRLAPTLQVASTQCHEYAITARGFASNIANKLLVMIDGRTVYSPLFSGVFWDAQDLVIDDIDRIEVISGPGGATWGTNAVNGVINIVTRSAADTQGVLAKAGAGNQERSVAARYGFALGAAGHARAYAKHYAQDASNARRTAERRPTHGNARRPASASTGARRPAATHCRATSTAAGDDDRPMFGALKIVGRQCARALVAAPRRRGRFRRPGLLRPHRPDRQLPAAGAAQLFDLEARGRFVTGAHRWLIGAGYRHAKDHSDPGVYFAFVPPIARWTGPASSCRTRSASAATCK